MSPTDAELPSLQVVPNADGSGAKHSPARQAGVLKQTGAAGQSVAAEQLLYWDGWKGAGARGRRGRKRSGAVQMLLPWEQVVEVGELVNEAGAGNG